MYYKYLKYRNKYLKLKNQYKKQNGGAIFRSIYNNGGGGEEGLGLQCIWITIRDYLNYHRGEKVSAVELKRRVGLGRETDTTEFDEDNNTLRTGLIRLAEQLRISLCFIYTRRNGEIAPYCLDDRGNMKQFRVINGGTGNNVYIATFGRHFELIIEGPNYNLERHQGANIEAKKYEPKIPINNVYKKESEISKPNEKELAETKINIIENKQNIDFFRNEITRLQDKIKEDQIAVNDIKNSGLLPGEVDIISARYVNEIKFNTEQIDKIRRKLRSLEDDDGVLEGILQSLQLY